MLDSPAESLGDHVEFDRQSSCHEPEWFSLVHGSRLGIAVIESTLVVQSLNVKTNKPVFNVIIEDRRQSRSLVRYVPDFHEFDQKIKAHYRKSRRVSLPRLLEPLSIPQLMQSHRDHSRITALFSRLALIRHASNSEKVEVYLRRCLLHPVIGRSTLLRDFLSAQRPEDTIVARQPSPALPEHVVNHRIHGDVSAAAFAGDDDEPEKIELSNFQIIKVLGGGSMGKVLLVKRFQSPRLMALKAIPKRVFQQEHAKHTKTERNILIALGQNQHPFLVRLHYAFQDNHFLFLALDFYAGGDLATQLRRSGSFSPERCRLYAAEILLGLEELHRQNIIYRDLKPENILLGADGHLVLTDFGLSKQVKADAQGRTATFCGTPEYMAPEMLRGESYSYEVDLWSLGVLLFRMTTGDLPFYDDNLEKMGLEILSGALTLPPVDTTAGAAAADADAQDLICGLLQRIPAERLTLTAARAHPYFTTTLDWAHVFEKRYRPPYVPSPDDADICIDSDYRDASPRLSSVSDPLGSSLFQGYSYIDTSSSCHLEDDDDDNRPSLISLFRKNNGSSLSVADHDAISIPQQERQRQPLLLAKNPLSVHPLTGYYFNSSDVVELDCCLDSDDPEFDSISSLSYSSTMPTATTADILRRYGTRQINANI